MRSLILSILVLFVSCQNGNDKYTLGEGFILIPGRHIISSNYIVFGINVKEFKDGSLTFNITDKLNKPIYDYGSVKTFSKYQKWRIFLHKNDNIWFYNSDLQEQFVLVKDTSTGKYKERIFPGDTIIPARFKRWLKE